MEIYTTITQSSKYGITNDPNRGPEPNQHSDNLQLLSSRFYSICVSCPEYLGLFTEAWQHYSVRGKSSTFQVSMDAGFYNDIIITGIPVIYESPQDTSVTETGIAVFNCSVSGQPTLAIEWFRQLPNGTTGPHLYWR